MSIATAKWDLELEVKQAAIVHFWAKLPEIDASNQTKANADNHVLLVFP